MVKVRVLKFETFWILDEYPIYIHLFNAMLRIYITDGIMDRQSKGYGSLWSAIYLLFDTPDK